MTLLCFVMISEPHFCAKLSIFSKIKDIEVKEKI